MEHSNPQERQESSLSAKIKRTGAFLGRLLRGPRPITGQHLSDALAQSRHEHEVVQPLFEKPAVKRDVTGDIQPADVRIGDGDILQAPVDKTGIVPDSAPTTMPEWAVDKRPGGVAAADASATIPGHAVTERPGGVPAAEAPLPPYAVTERPGGNHPQ